MKKVTDLELFNEIYISNKPVMKGLDKILWIFIDRTFSSYNIDTQIINTLFSSSK